MPIKWPKGKRPVFIGTGNTKAVRYGKRGLSSLVNEASLNAIADTGLQPEDIDGISGYSFAPHMGARNIRGYDIVDDRHLQHVLPLKNIRWSCNAQSGMSAQSVIEAANALAAGAVNYVLVHRTLHHPAGKRYGESTAGTAQGRWLYEGPYGLGIWTQYPALTYLRYLEKYGAKREAMAAIVLNANRNAQLNEYSVWNGRPITFEDYMNSRIVAWPMCIFDYDMPVDESGALVMTTEDRAKDTPHPGGYITGYATSPAFATKPHLLPVVLEEEYEAGFFLARNLYESAGVKPEDVDLIHIYDGYSPMVWGSLETFGFCGIGEGHEWAQGGRIALDGPNPMNTSGGNLGEGRLHGWAHVRETARQMMGTAGPRQLKNLNVALCELGGHGGGTAFICTRE